MGWKKKSKHINQIKKKLNTNVENCGSFKRFSYIERERERDYLVKIGQALVDFYHRNLVTIAHN